MNTRLANSKYLGGSDSIANLAVFPWLRSWKNQGVDWADHPHLKGWFDEIANRPAFKGGVEVLAAQRKPLLDERASEALLDALAVLQALNGPYLKSPAAPSTNFDGSMYLRSAALT